MSQGNHFGRDPAVNLTKIHGLEFIKWVGQEAWCDSPANTGEPKKKIGALQNACPKFISRPQTQSSYKLVSYRMVGLEICLTCACPTFPGKPRNLFSKKHVFYKMAWLTRKKILTKCLRLLQKCPWNGTWVKPFHSGNIQRYIYIYWLTNHILDDLSGLSKCICICTI